MRITLTAVVLFLASAFATVAQDKARVPGADVIAGSNAQFNGQEYTNTYLNFSILIPGGWTFFDAAKNHAAVELNKQVAARSGDAKLEASAAHTEVLFQANPPAFAGQEKQAILSVGIEQLTAPTTSEKYAGEQKALAHRTARIARDIEKVVYGGVTFWTYDIEGQAGRGSFRQRCLITVRRGVALFIVATYFDDRQEKIVNASLATLKFK